MFGVYNDQYSISNSISSQMCYSVNVSSASTVCQSISMPNDVDVVLAAVRNKQHKTHNIAIFLKDYCNVAILDNLLMHNKVAYLFTAG